MGEVLFYCLLLGLSAGLFFFAANVWARQTVAEVNIEKDVETVTTSPFFRMLLPFIQVGAHYIGKVPDIVLDEGLGIYGDSRLQQAGILGRFRVVLGRTRTYLDRQLTAAGKSDVFTPDEMLATMFLSSTILGALSVAFWQIFPATLCTLIFVIFGCYFPVLSLRDTVRRRQRKIVLQLPFSIDLLALALDAGLDFTSGLTRIVERQRGTPIAEEFGEMLRQIRYGMSRKKALQELADRTLVEDVISFSNNLIQADDLGSPIGPILRVQSEVMRVKRFQRAEKLAGEAPVKMLFPLTCFIMPTVFIVLFAPMLIEHMGWS